MIAPFSVAMKDASSASVRVPRRRLPQKLFSAVVAMRWLSVDYPIMPNLRDWCSFASSSRPRLRPPGAYSPDSMASGLGLGYVELPISQFS